MNMPLYQIDIKNFEYGRHKIVQFCCMRPNAWEHIWENWTFFVLEKICCVSVLIMWDVEIDESNEVEHPVFSIENFEFFVIPLRDAGMKRKSIC